MSYSPSYASAQAASARTFGRAPTRWIFQCPLISPAQTGIRRTKAEFGEQSRLPFVNARFSPKPRKIFSVYQSRDYAECPNNGGFRSAYIWLQRRHQPRARLPILRHGGFFRNRRARIHPGRTLAEPPKKRIRRNLPSANHQVFLSYSENSPRRRRSEHGFGSFSLPRVNPWVRG